MNNNLPIKQKNGFFYKIFMKIRQLFKRNKYALESNEIEKQIVLSLTMNTKRKDLWKT